MNINIWKIILRNVIATQKSIIESLWAKFDIKKLHFLQKTLKNPYLNDRWIIWQASLESGLRFRRLAYSNILNIGTSEDNIFVNFISGSYGTIRGPILGTERSHWKRKFNIEI